MLSTDQSINVICEILTFNCTKMRLAAGLRPDPLGEFIQRSHRPLSWILGIGRGNKGKGLREERKGREGKAKGKGRNRPR